MADRPRVLLFATTTGYQTRSFGEAAERLGVEIVFATDRCHVLEDPWRDHAIPVRFHEPDASVAAVVDAVAARPVDGVLVVGDRPTVIAARVARALGLPGHPPESAAIASDKEQLRLRMRQRGLRAPWFVATTIERGVEEVVADVSFPCVVKPVALSGSRGVMRADDRDGLAEAFDRLRRLLRAPDVLAERSEAHARVLIEEFVPGREFAIEGLMTGGELDVLAIYDKPDPLDGPFFEETIYVTPSRAARATQHRIASAVAETANAIGLRHGPVHAECRVNDRGVFVLEAAARPIGGLCARTLRLIADRSSSEDVRSLEELLLRHALGEPTRSWRREAIASGVMMIPIPARGVLRRVDGIDAARAVARIEDVVITAKTGQVIVPIPEGASYLGFIFARAARAEHVERALREAHGRLRIVADAELPVLKRA